MDNPFNTPAAEPETTTTTTTKENKMSDNQSNAKVTLTYKGGSGFDAPWIVLHENTIEDALASAQNPALKELMEVTQAGGQHFASQGKSAPAAGGGGRSGQPQGSQEPPAGAPDCPPGWTFRSGTSKAGNAYQGFFPPRGDDSKPIFFK